MKPEQYLLDLRSRLRDCPFTQVQIAAASGELSLSWVSKFSTGRLDNPSVRSLMALEKTLDSLEPSKSA